MRKTVILVSTLLSCSIAWFIFTHDTHDKNTQENDLKVHDTNKQEENIIPREDPPKSKKTDVVLGVIWNDMMHSIGNPEENLKHLFDLEEYIKNNPDEEVYSLFMETIRDNDLPNEHRIILIHVLGSIVTPESLQLLIDLYPLISEDMNDEEYNAHHAVLVNIKQIGSSGNLEFSPILKKVWFSEDDPKLLNAIGYAMSQMHSINTIDPFLEVLKNQDQYTSKHRDISKNITEKYLYNTKQLKKMEQYINGYDLDDDLLVSSGKAFAHRSHKYKNGIYTLIDWASEAPKEVKPMIDDWMTTIYNQNYDNEETIDSALQYVSETRFSNESIKSSIILILNKKEDI